MIHKNKPIEKLSLKESRSLLRGLKKKREEVEDDLYSLDMELSNIDETIDEIKARIKKISVKK